MVTLKRLGTSLENAPHQNFSIFATLLNLTCIGQPELSDNHPPPAEASAYKRISELYEDTK